MKSGNMHKLFAIFYFTAMLMSVAHFHKDLRVHHSDCKVCTLSQNLSGGDTPSTASVLPPVTFVSEEIVSIQHLIFLSLLKGYDALAPPALSLL